MSQQQTLFDRPREPRFFGPDLTPPDVKRLTGQLARVKDFMADGEWHTLRQIADGVGGSEPSVSARLRDLRKPFCGSLTVERKKVFGGRFMYRVI